MTMLSTLKSLVKKRKTVGRGGSRGGTSGKGNKGQKARSGPKVGPLFEGGQMPLTRRLPKRGFTNAPFKIVYEIVNLNRLEEVFGENAVIDKKTLSEKGIIKRRKKTLIKILAEGSITKKFVVHADAFSEAAQKAILDKGGEIHLTKEK